MPASESKNETNEEASDEASSTNKNSENNENDEINPLSMSDEDLDKMQFPPLEDTENENSEDQEEEDNQEGKKEEDTSSLKLDDKDNIKKEEEPDNENILDKEDDKIDSSDDSNKQNDEDTSDTSDTSDNTDNTDGTNNKEKQEDQKKSEDATKETDISDTKEKTSLEEINYKAEYEKLIAPFKANNSEMQIDNVEDAITLMKMGANYNKKMHGLKPHMKIIKMLDNNGLLSEEKLNFLIDLDKKNPDAITKLIKDSGIDPLNVDVEKNTEYRPKTYTVDDKEVELDTVLQEIEETSSYQDTIEIISNKWDQSSKQILFNEPGIIKVINEHVASGIYAEIDSVVQRERALGRLGSISDLEAYKAVGEQLQANNGFKNQKEQLANVEIQKESVIKKPDPKLKDRKRAASGTKNASVNKKKSGDFNPLALSDEEFEKVSANTFLT